VKQIALPFSLILFLAASPAPAAGSGWGAGFLPRSCTKSTPGSWPWSADSSFKVGFGWVGQIASAAGASQVSGAVNAVNGVLGRNTGGVPVWNENGFGAGPSNRIPGLDLQGLRRLP